MLELRDIMTPDVLTVSPELAIRDAMELFVARHVSGAPVVSGDEVVGVVSATDLLGFIAGLPSGGAPQEPDPGIDDVSGPVDGDEPPARYFADLWSEDYADVTDRFAAASAGEASPLDTHTIAEAMTRLPVCALPPATPVDVAAAYMRRAQIHRILVMTGSRLEGIVTTTDIVSAVADHRVVPRLQVFGAPRGYIKQRR
jgi:CBS domain-containing protein